MRKFVGRPLALCLGAAVVFTCLSAQRAAAQPDPNLPSNYGSVKLKSGFLPDPFKKDLVAGGNLETNLGGVKAKVTAKPDFKLYWTSGNFGYPLNFYVISKADTTLLINLPNSKYIANDDSGGNLNPLITLKNPQSGRYDIWVGTYNPTPAKATLYISERKVTAPVAGNAGGGGQANQPDPNLPSNYGSVTLKSGFLPDPYKKNLVAGGNIETTLGGVKAKVTAKPDFKLNWTSGNFGYPLNFYVISKADTTLLINLPNSKYIANDDSGGNLNPLITLKNPQSGRYDIWVGTYNPTPAAATLYISERKVKAPVGP